MLKRTLVDTLKKRLRDYPTVALVGSRQCGKTTLAKTLAKKYYDLEQESDRLRLDLEWNELFKNKDLVVLDEAQTFPEIFPRLRGAIDQKKRKGKFLLLGSIAPSLMHHVAESLAGRLSLVELTPLHYQEVTKPTLKKHWLRGGFPDGGILKPSRFPQWQKDYLDLLVQRDLPLWGLPSKPQTTARLLRLLAAVHGQMWNASQIGQSLGLSYHTVNQITDFLQGTFLIRKLQPYSANLKKRLVRTPKIYWRDSGLLHALWNVADYDALLHHPGVGASWEGYVIEQILNWFSQHGELIEPFYFRTSDGHEIDLLFEFRKKRWAIECKLTTTPRPADLQRLNLVADMVHADKRILVCQTDQKMGSDGQQICPLEDFFEML
ncbi:MAG: ATP-binding protein [Verrucomicrobiota bacterium]